MKNISFIITTVIIFAICAPDVLSVQNNAIRNPAIEYTTIPPSSYENFSYQNPNPMGTNGNSIVTGNVRQGARFQGEVPYRSTSSFSSANLGTSTLSSFMRDSSGSEDFERYQSNNTSAAGSYRPYQLQSETVTTMSHEGTGISNQLNTRINSQTQRVSTLQTPKSQQFAETSTNSIESPASSRIYYPGTSLLQNQYNNTSELKRISPRTQQDDQMSTNQNRYRQNEMYRPEQYKYTEPSQTTNETIQSLSNDEIDGALQAKINSELLRYNPGYTPDRTSTSLRKESQGQLYQANTQLPYDNFREKTTSVNPNPRGYEIAATSEFYSPAQNGNSAANNIAFRSDNVVSSIKRNLQQRQYNPAPEAVQGNQFSTDNFNIENVDSDVLRQIKSKLDDLTQSIDARLESEQYDPANISQRHNSSLVSRESSSKYQATSHENKSYSDEKSYPATARPNSPKLTRSTVTSIQSNPAPPARDGQVQATVQDKFNEYYLTGDKHLKAGRYYEAAESFATAAIYKPDSASCSAGQGHALLATGQYISSALFLIRAVELEPEYIQTDINLVEIVGGKTKLENKINELQQLIRNNPASGLKFLLGYVYFKTDRIVEAKQMTNSLYQEMSKSPAALSLKIAVDLKLKNQ